MIIEINLELYTLCIVRDLEKYVFVENGKDSEKVIKLYQKKNNPILHPDLDENELIGCLNLNHYQDEDTNEIYGITNDSIVFKANDIKENF